MLAIASRGDVAVIPEPHLRRAVLDLLADLGPHLLAASRALDGPTPESATVELREAALLLAPYLP